MASGHVWSHDHFSFIEQGERAYYHTIKLSLKASSLFDDISYTKFCIARFLLNYSHCKDVLDELGDLLLEELCLMIPKDLWPDRLQQTDKCCQSNHSPLLLRQWIECYSQADNNSSSTTTTHRWLVDNVAYVYDFIRPLQSPNKLLISSTVISVNKSDGSVSPVSPVNNITFWQTDEWHVARAVIIEADDPLLSYHNLGDDNFGYTDRDYTNDFVNGNYAISDLEWDVGSRSLTKQIMFVISNSRKLKKLDLAYKLQEVRAVQDGDNLIELSIDHSKRWTVNGKSILEELTADDDYKLVTINGLFETKQRLFQRRDNVNCGYFDNCGQSDSDWISASTNRHYLSDDEDS